jgi:hypothetical protein
MITAQAAAALGQQELGRIELGQPLPKIVLPALSDGQPATVDGVRETPTLLIVFASW